MTNTEHPARNIRALFDEVTDSTTTAYDALTAGLDGLALASMLNAQSALTETIAALRAEITEGN